MTNYKIVKSVKEAFKQMRTDNQTTFWYVRDLKKWCFRGGNESCTILCPFPNLDEHPELLEIEIEEENEDSE